MKHLVFFSLFTISFTSYSMDYSSALQRLPIDTGNSNAHEVADLYVQQVCFHTSMHGQTLTKDGFAMLGQRARTIRQLEVTDAEKKAITEMVVQKLKEDDLLESLLLWGKNERPKKTYRIR